MCKYTNTWSIRSWWRQTQQQTQHSEFFVYFKNLFYLFAFCLFCRCL